MKSKISRRANARHVGNHGSQWQLVKLSWSPNRRVVGHTVSSLEWPLFDRFLCLRVSIFFWFWPKILIGLWYTKFWFAALPAVLYWYWHTTRSKQSSNSCYFEVARWSTPNAILKCLRSLQLNSCVWLHPDLWKHLFQYQDSFLNDNLDDEITEIILRCSITV